jgi:hypothetical protein
MGFTSVIFLFLFVPGSICLYYLAFLLEKNSLLKRIRVKGIALVCISIAFYGWTGRKGIKFICIYVIFVYLLGNIVTLSRKKVKYDKSSWVSVLLG